MAQTTPPPRCPACDSYPGDTLCIEHYWGDRPEPIHSAVREAREALLEEEAERVAAQDDAFHRFWRCLMLAPSLSVCRSLLRGDKVPDDQLDQHWFRRFRRRDAA